MSDRAVLLRQVIGNAAFLTKQTSDLAEAEYHRMSATSQVAVKRFDPPVCGRAPSQLTPSAASSSAAEQAAAEPVPSPGVLAAADLSMPDLPAFLDRRSRAA